MPTMNDAFPSKYLSAADLGGRNVAVTIAGYEQALIDNKQKYLLTFKGGKKALVLNKTNAKNIAKLYGDDLDGWVGQPIVLFEAMVDFQGETVAAIRVKAPPPKAKTSAQQDAPPAEQAPVARKSSAEMDDEIPF